MLICIIEDSQKQYLSFLGPEPINLDDSLFMKESKFVFGLRGVASHISPIFCMCTQTICTMKIYIFVGQLS